MRRLRNPPNNSQFWGPIWPNTKSCWGSLEPFWVSSIQRHQEQEILRPLQKFRHVFHTFLCFSGFCCVFSCLLLLLMPRLCLLITPYHAHHEFGSSSLTLWRCLCFPQSVSQWCDISIRSSMDGHSRARTLAASGDHANKAFVKLTWISRRASSPLNLLGKRNEEFSSKRFSRSSFSYQGAWSAAPGFAGQLVAFHDVLGQSTETAGKNACSQGLWRPKRSQLRSELF